MATQLPRALLALRYEEAAQAYLRSLPLEHFMEATTQATQREITLESLALVKARRPEVQVFNELLVQYPHRGSRRFGQVVPDNMVVLCEQPSKAVTSFNVPLELAPPFWVLEYVSKYNKRKDYEESFQKYERELKVPYYLLFYPDDQELTLFQLDGRRYQTVHPNEHGRHAIPELDLELALRDGWVRYWYKGWMLALPAELQRQVAVQKRRANDLQRRLKGEQAARRAAEEELAQLPAKVQQASTRQS